MVRLGCLQTGKRDRVNIDDSKIEVLKVVIISKWIQHDMYICTIVL